MHFINSVVLNIGSFSYIFALNNSHTSNERIQTDFSSMPTKSQLTASAQRFTNPNRSLNEHSIPGVPYPEESW